MMAFIGHITKAIAEAEPEQERLFNRPPRRPGVLLKTIDTKRVRAAMKSTESY
jgi:hypothetical protein